LACSRAGIPCGIFTSGVGKAAERRDEGYRLVVLANDIDVVNDSFAAAVRGFGERT
jgi:2-dehydro-3-deoxyglucarate aldolase/4-hydroxy-2-oxoheptanedioate aldolase